MIRIDVSGEGFNFLVEAPEDEAFTEFIKLARKQGLPGVEKRENPRRKSRTELSVERVDGDTICVWFAASSGSDSLMTAGIETFKIPSVGGKREFKSEWPR